jgi:hypothetical protein
MNSFEISSYLINEKLLEHFNIYPPCAHISRNIVDIVQYLSKTSQAFSAIFI